MHSNLKNEHKDHRSGLNATEVTSYQYLGMVDGGLLGFSATVAVRVDGEGLLPSATVCLV
jgi:hypothetical protein